MKVMAFEGLARLRQKAAYAAVRRAVCSESGMRCPNERCLFDAARNPLLAADDTAFLSVSSSGGAACALTGHFGGDGFFSSFFGNSRAAADELVKAIIRRQKEWGVKRISGPVSPSYADTEGGWTVEGFDEPVSCFADRTPRYMPDVLRENGFLSERRFLLYQMRLDEHIVKRYQAAAEWSQKRFGYIVLTARDLGDRAACEAVKEVLRAEPLEGMTARTLERTLGALGRDWSRPMTQIAVSGNEPIGYLLALYDRTGGIARAATIHVRRDWRRKAVTASLGCGFLRHAEDCVSIECGLIGEDNMASRLTAERAGCTATRSIERWKIDI